MRIEDLFERDPEKMFGAAVFPGTCVPIKFLFEFLEDDQTMGTFLHQFPTVSRTQALAVVRASRDLFLSIPTNSDARPELMQEFATGELFLADVKVTLEDFGQR
jgi:uncharacterized protein (DUF433 family)